MVIRTEAVAVTLQPGVRYCGVCFQPAPCARRCRYEAPPGARSILDFRLVQDAVEPTGPAPA